MSDWQKADQQHLRTYRGFTRLVVVSTVVIVIGLVVMAITLV